MGGYGFLNDQDIKFSEYFLGKLILKDSSLTLGNVLDCGAGIGRVSKELLSRVFKKVDLLE